MCGTRAGRLNHHCDREEEDEEVAVLMSVS